MHVLPLFPPAVEGGTSTAHAASLARSPTPRDHPKHQKMTFELPAAGSASAAPNTSTRAPPVATAAAAASLAASAAASATAARTQPAAVSFAG